MILVFLHGWSVTSTDTYGGLPAALVKNAPASLNIAVHHLHLAKYISFSDEVRVDDIARGMQRALEQEVFPQLAKGERFACITHSTGGPVARTWIDNFYGGKIDKSRMSHLVMLAPANQGSALAQLGKSRVSRLKSLIQDVQPGIGVLDWLELGSTQSWKLNRDWLGHDCVKAGLFPFVLAGQWIDRKLYDHLNAYTDEAGSDGVVRVASANLNYGIVRLQQEDGVIALKKEERAPTTAFGVLPKRSHSGDEWGIMRSVKADDDGTHPTVHWVLRCLSVDTVAAYNRMTAALTALTTETQKAEERTVERRLLITQRTFHTSRYCMFVFRMTDDRNNTLTDYDVIFTAGPQYDPNHLPEGFFVDRQRNSLNAGQLTYYVDYDRMDEWMKKPELQGKFGLRIAARPSEGFAYYTVAEFRGTFAQLRRYFEPNQTLMVEVQLKRHVTEGVFRLTGNLGAEDFKNQPKGADLA